jgi:hypothetical protein
MVCPAILSFQRVLENSGRGFAVVGRGRYGGSEGEACSDFSTSYPHSSRPGGWRSWWLIRGLSPCRIGAVEGWDSGKKMSTVPDNGSPDGGADAVGGAPGAAGAIPLTSGREFGILRLMDRFWAIYSDWGVFTRFCLSTHVKFVAMACVCLGGVVAGRPYGGCRVPRVEGPFILC